MSDPRSPDSFFMWEVMDGDGRWNAFPATYQARQTAENAIPSFHKVFGNRTRVVECVTKERVFQVIIESRKAWRKDSGEDTVDSVHQGLLNDLGFYEQ